MAGDDDRVVYPFFFSDARGRFSPLVEVESAILDRHHRLRHHLMALMCDDIETTVEQLRAKGAQFRGPIEQREYGRIIMMIVPGADDIQLYQPTHKLAYNL